MQFFKTNCLRGTKEEIEQKHQQLEENIYELKEKPRRNNLRFSNDIAIEKPHRTGSQINRTKIAIIVKFLNYKDKDVVLNQYRQKQLWKDNIYLNAD